MRTRRLTNAAIATGCAVLGLVALGDIINEPPDAARPQPAPALMPPTDPQRPAAGMAGPTPGPRPSRAATCRIRAHAELPDPSCTPGAVVTTDRATVCRPGYASTVRPPESRTEPLKRAQLRLYGYAGAPLSGFEEDHLIPLELGGAPIDGRNLWPEPHASSFEKDLAENRLHNAVCGGLIPLERAQRRIARDWRTALRGLNG